MFVGYPGHYQNESLSDGNFFETKHQSEINRPALSEDFLSFVFNKA